VRNGGTWRDGTIYYEVVPKDAFDKILWIDSDRLGYMINTVTEEALEAEKQVVKNEKRERVDNAPYGFTSEIIYGNLYPEDHPYHWPVIGSLPDLQAATLKDVKEFYEMYYGANNGTLVIAGDIDVAETKEKVKQWFGEIRRGPVVEQLPPMPASLNEVERFYFEDNFATLPELRLVFPTVENYHKDMYALEVLGELLSGSRKSPLYKIVVEEKKQAPSVSAYQDSNELAGEFVFRIRANAMTDLDDVKASIEEGLATFERQGFTKNELERVKAEREMALYQGIGTVLNKAFTLAVDNEFKGDPAHIVQAAELMQAVTREDIFLVYERYIRDKHYIMTSVVPKGQANLAVTGSQPATVWQEPIVAGMESENVSRGDEAQVEKTITRFDRSEPDFGEPALFEMPEMWKGKLSNGMAILGIENDEVPLVYFDITVPGGHAYDPKDKAGVANFLSELMRQGTATRTPAELDEAIGLLGSSVSLQCTNEEIRIHGQCLARNFEATLALVKEILLEPRWDAKEFDRIKAALMTNLTGQEADAQTIARKNFYALLYGPDHFLGSPLTGSRETVDAITMEDLKDYYASYFSPANSFFHVVGDINKEEALRTVQMVDKSWQARAVSPPKSKLNESAASGNVYFIDFPGAKQSVLFAGKLTVSALSSDLNNLEFANETLGGGSSGKLFQTLRIEKGYTYGAYSFIAKANEVSPFVAYSSVRSNATLASLQIIESLLKGHGKTFTEKAAEVTREKILKSNTLEFESLGAKKEILYEISKFGRAEDFIEQDQRELLAMTRADFRSVIDKYLREDEMIYLIVGDKATQLTEVEKLKGSVKELDIHGSPVANDDR
jgi:zinc protease